MYVNSWDARATKVATGYDRVLNLRVRNVKAAWDRGGLGEGEQAVSEDGAPERGKTYTIGGCGL